MSIIAKSSEKAILKWKSGLTGGSVQMFKLILKRKSEDYTLHTHYNTSSVGELFKFTLTGLIPEMLYSIIVVSINEYNGSSETESKEVNFTTRGKSIQKLVVLCLKSEPKVWLVNIFVLMFLILAALNFSASLLQCV